MADMIECELSISGSRARVEEFLRLVKSEESDFDFNHIIAYPERFKELDRIAADWTPERGQTWQDRPLDGFTQGGGLKWCEENWGVKWLSHRRRGELHRDKRFQMDTRGHHVSSTVVSADAGR